MQGKISNETSVQRISFSEITKSAVESAIATPRAVDTDLVEAYMARICADYLLGFSVSPMLWRKLPGTKSAGRVQSVALRLVCDREEQRDVHKSVKYFTATAVLAGKPYCDQACPLAIFFNLKSSTAAAASPTWCALGFSKRLMFYLHALGSKMYMKMSGVSIGDISWVITRRLSAKEVYVLAMAAMAAVA